MEEASIGQAIGVGQKLYNEETVYQDNKLEKEIKLNTMKLELLKKEIEKTNHLINVSLAEIKEETKKITKWISFIFIVLIINIINFCLLPFIINYGAN